MFDVIERLKTDWTDKYVMVDRTVPELARFAGTTGQVRTVNMNGRCLVEFEQYNNVGWYDIDPAFLTVVPRPEPRAKVEKKAAAPSEKKPAGKKPESKPDAKPAKAGRPSTADILAMARGKAAAARGPSPEAVAEPAMEATTDVPAAAEPTPPAPAPRATSRPDDAQPTTTVEKIAWCRAHDGGR